MLRLRLARFGCKNRPFYRVVAINSKKARDDKPIEYVGTYDPIPFGLDATKEVRLRLDRIKYWLSVGAQPSDRVSYLLWRAGLLPAPPIPYCPQQWVPKKVRREQAKKSFHTWSSAAAASAAAPADAGAGAASAAAALAAPVLRAAPRAAMLSGFVSAPRPAAFSGFARASSLPFLR